MNQQSENASLCLKDEDGDCTLNMVQLVVTGTIYNNTTYKLKLKGTKCSYGSINTCCEIEPNLPGTFEAVAYAVQDNECVNSGFAVGSIAFTIEEIQDMQQPRASTSSAPEQKPIDPTVTLTVSYAFSIIGSGIVKAVRFKRFCF